MKQPRFIAAQALLKVESRKAWSNRTLDNLLLQEKTEPRDAAFVSALFYGVLERQITLDACIAAHSKQPLEKLSPAVLQALRLAVYQLIYMDSVPESAAVNESVELTRKLRKASAAGFVNGVLRSFLRSGKQIPLPKDSTTAALSVEYSCPQPLVKLWTASYGEEATRRLLGDSLGRPPIYLRVNTLQISDEELISRLSAHGMKVLQDPDLPHCLVVEDAGALHKLPEYRRGFFHVQDKSSQLCAVALDIEPGMRVLDACAAPGGKAFTLAQLMENRGEIVAADLHPQRIKLVAARAKEMGITCMTTTAADMSQPDETLGSFDAVLCDVPCSGLGVIRRKPEIKYKDLSEFENLPSLQYKILETTAHYLKDGGRLIYSTCTLHPAENGGVVERFLQAHPEFRPANLPEILGGGPQRTLLGELGADGFYFAALERRP